jgi:NADH:ubiquinone oxidoreductase subunit 3 (subunit A)
MTGNGWLSAIPFTGLVLLLVLLYETLVRKQRKARPSHVDTHAVPVKVSVALLCAFVCSVGAILLIPWATALPLRGARGLLPGILVIAFLTIGVLYALKDVDVIE